MFRLFSKILSARKTVVLYSPNNTDPALMRAGEELRAKIGTVFGDSLAIREVAAGSSNAEEQELVALSNPFYDIERFGVSFVASPRHADALFVTGPVARNMAEALRRTYEATPDPKLVVAVGDAAIDGGIFKGSYAIAGGVKDVIPVDIEIPGDPPTPAAVIDALSSVVDKIGKNRKSRG